MTIAVTKKSVHKYTKKSNKMLFYTLKSKRIYI